MKTFVPVVFSATLCLIAIAFFSSHTVRGQREQTNYDESKVPPYTLPDPLVMSGGERVVDARTWMGKRRGEVLKLFETHVYGRSPGRPSHLKFEVTSTDPTPSAGKPFGNKSPFCLPAARTLRRRNFSSTSPTARKNPCRPSLD